MEVHVDNGQVKVGSTILPGVFESVEVEDSTKIDEVEIEGNKKKAAQSISYTPTKIKLNLILLTDSRSRAEDKLEVIARVYRPAKAQKTPPTYRIICDQAQAHGVDKVIFSDLRSRGTNMDDTISVSCEFTEHQSVGVSVSKKGKKSINYTVQKGDTLSAIAHKYGITTRALAAANHISDAQKLYVGQKLIIPGVSTKTKKKSGKKTAAPRVKDSTTWTNADIKSTALEDDAKPPKYKR